MDDFSLPGVMNYFNVSPSEANYLKPGKRPMSSMAPIIVVDENNDVRLVLGSSGGSKIISAVSTVIEKIINFHVLLIIYLNCRLQLGISF
jgi:gamma-glutamyltranspeptidase/glutathione hydrolase/leukotriene-C4 hydrolase